jgi:VanZ family protein
VHHLVRKLAHFTEFLVLGVLLYRALDGTASARVSRCARS